VSNFQCLTLGKQLGMTVVAAPNGKRAQFAILKKEKMHEKSDPNTMSRQHDYKSEYMSGFRAAETKIWRHIHQRTSHEWHHIPLAALVVHRHASFGVVLRCSVTLIVALKFQLTFFFAFLVPECLASV
jgi:hypothetical protein